MSTEPIRNTVASLKTKGVVFASDVIDDGELLLAHFQDADGNLLYLAEMKYARGRDTRVPAVSAKS